MIRGAVDEPTTGPTPTQAKRAQRKRQRDRLQSQVAERTAQRNRARRDREALADWIDENLSAGWRVNRDKSGRWHVEEKT